MIEFIVTYRDNGLCKCRQFGYHVSDARKRFKDDVGNYPIVKVELA